MAKHIRTFFYANLIQNSLISNFREITCILETPIYKDVHLFPTVKFHLLQASTSWNICPL